MSHYIKIHPGEPSCSMWTEGETDRHDEANSRYSQILRRRLKITRRRVTVAVAFMSNFMTCWTCWQVPFWNGKIFDHKKKSVMITMGKWATNCRKKYFSLSFSVLEINMWYFMACALVTRKQWDTFQSKFVPVIHEECLKIFEISAPTTVMLYVWRHTVTWTFQILGAFTKLRKATISFVMSVRLPLDGFLWNLIFEYFQKHVEESEVSLKSDTHNRYFTLRSTYIFDHISLSASQNEKCFRQNLYRKSKHTFYVKYSFFFHFRKSCRFWARVEKYCTTGQATDDIMTHAHCMLNT